MPIIPPPPLPSALATPEFALLTACCYLDRQQWPEQRVRIVQLLQETTDPARVVELATRQRVIILVHHVLRLAAPDMAVAQAICQQLQPAAQRLRLFNLGLHGELHLVQRRLTAAGIRMKALKGTRLPERLYGDHGLRQMRDLDILVRPRDLQATLQVLQANGYEPDIGPSLRHGLNLRLVRQMAWHFECRNAHKGILLELHWRLEHLSQSRLHAVWSEWLEAEDAAAAHYELLYLCLHGAGHHWQSLRWLADVRVLFGQLDYERDWQDLLTLAARLRMQSILAETLLLVHWLTGWPLPVQAEALIGASGPAVPARCREYLEVMAGQRPLDHLDHAQSPADLWQLLARWNDRHSLGERLRHVVLTLCLSYTDMQRLRLPPALVWLYPLIRPFSLMWRYWTAR